MIGASAPGDGRRLLATMDAALMAGGDHAGWRATVCHEEGLEAAVALDALLRRHGLGWEDVIAPGHRLARICGQLGSAFPAERAAAYHHGVRLLLLRGSRWSHFLRLPEAVRRAPADDAPAAPVPPPEGDWRRTVQVLMDRREWRSATEQERLRGLEQALAGGAPIAAADAAWLRELWWCDELDDAAAGDTP